MSRAFARSGLCTLASQATHSTNGQYLELNQSENNARRFSDISLAIKIKSREATNLQLDDKP